MTGRGGPAGGGRNQAAVALAAARRVLPSAARQAAVRDLPSRRCEESELTVRASTCRAARSACSATPTASRSRRVPSACCATLSRHQHAAGGEPATEPRHPRRPPLSRRRARPAALALQPADHLSEGWNSASGDQCRSLRWPRCSSSILPAPSSAIATATAACASPRSSVASPSPSARRRSRAAGPPIPMPAERCRSTS